MENVTRSKLNDVECGKRLRERRKECRLTQAQLSEKINELEEKIQTYSDEKKERLRSDKQISYLETGSRPISFNYARLISIILGVRHEWLMGYDDYKTQEEYEKFKKECVTHQSEQLREKIAKSFRELEICKEKRYRAEKTLEALRMTLTENQEGLEELSCYSRVMGGKTADNIHTLNFLECIHEKGDSDAFQEYMAFYNGRMQTERAYIFFDETGENVRYMSEPEYWQFVDEICGYMDYVEYKAHQILKKKNSKEEQNG